MGKIKNSEFLELRKKIIEKDFEKMNDRQKEAIFHIEGPLLILAGAGSGKTTVLVNRIANMIKYGDSYASKSVPSGVTDDDLNKMKDCIDKDVELDEAFWGKIASGRVDAQNILAITFTNKAAGELKERISQKLGSKGEEIWSSTFHSTCSKILRFNADRIGYSKHFTIYDVDDSKRIIKDCQKVLDVDDKLIPHKSIMSEISNAKDQFISPEQYKSLSGGDYRKEKIADVYAMYQSKLKDANAMDFDDLIFNTVSLFQNHKDVLGYYQDKFKYILVDEYQDTNHVQYMFVSLLASKNKNLCVVGDDDQSIYKFRGATIENILNFEKEYKNSEVIRLEQNYRSTKNILDAANAVIENNESRKGKSLWTENSEGENISIYTSLNEHEEAEYISDTVLSAVSQGAKYSDFAVLYRMNAQSNAIEKMFVKSGVPYRIIGGVRFYERREIRDMIAYLSVINNPYDEIRLRRIINRPRRSIGNKTIVRAMSLASDSGKELMDIIRDSENFEDLKRVAPKLTGFSGLIDSLISSYREDHVSLSELYRSVLDKTGYVEAVLAENDDSENRVNNVNELLSSIKKYEEENGDEATLEGFLEEVSLLTDVDNYDENTDAVVMMTMHSAKGLEFNNVFIPGFEEGIFPGVKVAYNQSELEEERRLAYVAITRAKKKLYILNTDSRMMFGSTARNKLSRFAREIPKEIVEMVGARQWKKIDPKLISSVSVKEARAKSVDAARNFGQAKFLKREVSVIPTPGERVKHKAFGEGTVVSVTQMGNDSLLSVNFDDIGSKRLMANFSNLQIV